MHQLNYIDYGQGPVVILIHGWPLSYQSWELQIQYLVEQGCRVIAYDRKGFGNSHRTWGGYDYDGLAGDLHELIERLDLNDITLVGFSMGGGEVIRYLSKYGSKRVKKAALISSIIPLVKQKADNPEGVPQKVLDAILNDVKHNRLKFLTDFHKGFYNYTDKEKTVSEEQLQFDFSVASHASLNATIKAAQSWMDTDFREECKTIDTPFLIIHGDADATVPIGTSGDQASKLLKNNEYKIYKNAPHGLNVTHAEQLNKDLLAFIQK